MSLLTENTRRWKEMKLKPGALALAKDFADRAIANRPIYDNLSHRIAHLGHYIPWWVIAIIHERECLRGVRNTTCNIGQGSPYSVKSRIKPYNGPFTSFDDAAVDSLVNQAPQAALNTNWSGGGTLTVLEKYNGLGYARKGRPSPYIWAHTDQYVKGKYVADNKYDPDFVDTQLGCAVMLSALLSADPSIKLEDDVAGQSDVSRKSEATVVVSGGGGLLASINALLPYYDLNWTDISIIVVVSVSALAYIVHRIIKAKKGSV